MGNRLSIVSRGGWICSVHLGLIGSAFTFGCGAGPSADLERVGEIAQRFGADGSLSLRVSRASTETGTQVASTQLSARTFVTSLKQTNGTVRHILWRLNNEDSMDRLDSAVDSTLAGGRVSVARIDDERFVVAMQTSTGALRVTVWTAIGNSVKLVATRDDTAVSDVDVVGMSLAPGRKFNASLGVPAAADFVVGIQTPEGALRLIDFQHDESNNIVRRDSAVMSSTITGNIKLAKVPGPNRLVVSSSTLFNGANAPFARLHAWDIASNGAVTLKGQTAGTTGSASVTPLAFQRIAALEWAVNSVTGSVRSTLVARTWDVSSAGQFTEHAHADILTADASRLEQASIVAGGASRLFVAYGKTPNGSSTTSGRLAAFDAADDLRIAQDTGLSGSQWKNSGAVLSLSESHPILAWLSNSATVSVDAYRDYNIPLLRGNFPPSGTLIPSPAPTGGTISDVGNTASDLTLAVGHNYVMACNASIRFYDKSGVELPKKYTGAPSSVSYSSLFSSVMDQASPNSLSRHLSYQEDCNADAAASSTNKCPNAVFDARCAYDPQARRFVIMAMARWDGTPKDYTQRFVAMAVSKQEDPRDGFNIFIADENKSVDDNPQLSVSAGSLIVAHQAPTDPHRTDDLDFPFDDDHDRLVPSAYVINVGDLSSNMLNPRVTKTTLPQTGGTAALKVAVTGDSKVALLSRSGARNNLELYAFRPLGRGPLTVTPTSAPYTSAVRSLEDTQPLLWMSFVADDAQGNAHRVGHVYVSSAQGPTTACDRNVGSGGSKLDPAGSERDCDSRISAIPITIDTTTSGFSISTSASDADVVVPCPGRTSSIGMACSRVSVGASSTQVVMGFRRLQYDLSNNGPSGLPEEYRTVRFDPANLAFLDSAPAGDRSRLAQAGVTPFAPRSGFMSTIGDPSNSSVWSIGEATTSTGLHALIVKRP
jgi:hypothetical protein